MKHKKMITVWASMLLFITSLNTYPIDGYDISGIKRLKRLQMILNGVIKDATPIAGALKSIRDIKLNLADDRGAKMESIPSPDPMLQKALNGLFPNLHQSYSVALLDLTPDKEIRYAARKETAQYQPGSVGKIAVVVGMFAELKKIYPDFKQRQNLLKTRKVRGGKWVMTDSHTIPIFNTETNAFIKRTAQESDVFSLYEWIDFMLSVSNNGAASVCWRETILMRAFGKDYPQLTEEQAADYFKNTPKADLSNIAIAVVNEPLRVLGIGEDEWRLGTLFTRGGSSYIPPKGGSTGSPLGLMKFLVAMEKGQVVDKESSLEIKRLMYMTDRRIRYATAPALASAAVYFKSGSLYQCREEEGYTCGKYKGNKSNYMNSVAIIEHEDGTTYMVVLMSNVLKKNSSSDHQALASSIEKIIRQ